MTDLTNFFKEDIFNEYIEENITENKDKICMICSSEYNDLNKVTFECNHVFHNSCIFDLLKTSKHLVCPYCNMYQNKYLKNRCQNCVVYTYADSKLCGFHATLNRCSAILKYGPNKGKQCKYKRKNGKIYCLVHKHYKP